MKNWICIDPNMNQYGRKLKNGVFEFKQDMKYPDGVVVKEQGIIYLEEYTEEEINDILSSYSWSVKQLKEENSLEDAEWLMAECIFEQTIF